MEKSPIIMFWKLFSGPKVKELKSSELKEMIHAGNGRKPIIIDVRTPQEWKQTGVIPGSIMMTPNQLEIELDKNLDLNKQRPIVVVCRSGVRSKRVAKKLMKRDIEDVFNLKGGIIAWYNVKGDIERV